jgi:predicted GNAT family acetyltransferase
MTDGTRAADAARITNHPEEQRYEAWLDGAFAGKAEYRIVGDRVIFFHTEIDPAFEGRGVGSRLARGALDDVRERGLRVTPRCPFIAAWIARHPDYQALVAERPARRSGG